MDWVIWGYRQIFCCKRRIYKIFYDDEKPKHYLVSPADLPWLWLGISKYTGETIVVTQNINDMMYHGIRVTPEYLSNITGFDSGVWKYIDSKTLEEKDFPSEGFIIGKCQE